MLFLQLFQQKLLQCFLVGQLKHIGRNEEVVIHAGKGILHHLLALARAEQDADWRVVARLHLVLAIMRYVCVELSEVLVGELLVLQFYDYVAMQYAVVEHKVGIVILVVDDDALLASLEAEALAEFEDELLQVADKRIFQVMLVNNFLRLQSKKLERERLAYLQLCRIVPLNRRERKQFFGIGADASPDI